MMILPSLCWQRTRGVMESADHPAGDFNSDRKMFSCLYVREDRSKQNLACVRSVFHTPGGVSLNHLTSNIGASGYDQRDLSCNNRHRVITYSIPADLVYCIVPFSVDLEKMVKSSISTHARSEDNARLATPVARNVRTSPIDFVYNHQKLDSLSYVRGDLRAHKECQQLDLSEEFRGKPKFAPSWWIDLIGFSGDRWRNRTFMVENRVEMFA